MVKISCTGSEGSVSLKPDRKTTEMNVGVRSIPAQYIRFESCNTNVVQAGMYWYGVTRNVTS